MFRISTGDRQLTENERPDVQWHGKMISRLDSQVVGGQIELECERVSEWVGGCL